MATNNTNENQYSKEDLIQYRIQRAYESLDEARLMTESQHYNTSVSRLYYSCYYAVIALLLKYDIASSTHAGVRNQFGLHFVKTNIVLKEDATVFSFLFDQRHKSDYDDFVIFNQSEVADLQAKAGKFIEHIEKIIRT